MPKNTTSKKPVPPKKPVLLRLNEVLGFVFYVIWILIGLLFILFIAANFRQGAFKGLFSPTTNQQVPQTQVPTETTIAGIGKVNIACVRDSLSNEAISKIVEAGNKSKVSDEEKAKFEPCVMERDESATSPSP